MEKSVSEEEIVQATRRVSLSGSNSPEEEDFNRVLDTDDAKKKADDVKEPGSEPVQPNRKMNLFDIPPEVFTKILGQLSLSDVFSFRHACKSTSAIGADHISVYRIKSNLEIIVISEEGCLYDKPIDTDYRTISMASLLQFEIHLFSSRFSLKFLEDEEQAGNRDALKFVERYGKQITHLKMFSMTLPFVSKFWIQAQFYQGLPNLKTLKIDQIEVKKVDGQQNLQRQDYFPSTLKNVETLEIDTVLLNFPPASCKDHFWNLLKYCNKLETIRIPKFYLDDEDDPDLDWGFKYYIVGMLKELSNHLKLVHLKNEERRLKYLDMENFKHIHMGDHPQIEQEKFAEFLTLCAMKPVKLQNVPMEVIRKLAARHDEDQKVQLRQIVTSVIHAHPDKMPWDFENLEKVSFRYTGSVFGDGIPRHPPVWPKLTAIEVNVNKIMRQAQSRVSRLGGGLFDLLFKNCRRPLVTDLNMNYEILPDYDRNHVRFPFPHLIVAACPNLTKLSINNWHDLNFLPLYIFWNTLTHLEEVCLENLRYLNLESFTGQDRRNPAFLRLTNLQKLSLLGVHRMRYINDEVFRTIFRQLKVREFHLTSWEENEIVKVKWITRRGVESLLTGEFAKCIRKFPFDCWALKDTNEEEFETLRVKFRPAHSL